MERIFIIRVDSDGAVKLRELDREAKKAQKSTDDLDGSTQKLSKSSQGLSKEVDVLKTRYLGWGAAIGSATAVVSSSIKQFAQYEKAIAEVNTLLGQGQNIDAYSKSVRELSKQFGLNNVEQARAMYQVISSGAGDAAEANAILTASNKLAVGGVTNVATAADGLTSIINAYGLEASSAGAVSDILFATMRGGRTTIGELSATVGQVAPIAARLGVEFGELSAAISTLTGPGVKTSQVVTQIRAVLTQLIKPSKEAAETAQSLGLEFNAAALQSKGLAGFLQDLQDKTEGNVETIGKLFGSVEAIQAILPIVGESSDKFAESLVSTSNAAGQTDAAVAKMQETLDYKWGTLIAQFKDMAISIGQNLSPAVVKLLDGVRALLPYLDDIGISLAALAVARTMGPLIVSLGVAMRGAASATGLFSAALIASKAPALALSGVLTGLRSVLAFVGGPAGVAILAATAITAFATSANDAVDDVSGLRDEVDRLTKSQEQLSLQSAETALSQTRVAIQETRQAIQELNAEMTVNDSLGEEFGGSNDHLAIKVSGLTEKLELLTQKESALGVEINKLNAKTLEAGGGFESFAQSTDTASQSTEQYSDKITKIIQAEQERQQEIQLLTDHIREHGDVNGALAARLESLTRSTKKQTDSVKELSAWEKELIKDVEAHIKAEQKAEQASKQKLDTVLRSIETEQERTLRWYNESVEALQDAERRKVDSTVDFVQARLRLDQEYVERTNQIQKQSHDQQSENLNAFGKQVMTVYDQFSGAWEALQDGNIDSALSSFEQIADNWEDMLKNMLLSWAASGIAELFKGNGFSGFSIENLFSGGSGGGLTVGGINGSNINLGQYGNLATSGAGTLGGAYSTYQQASNGNYLGAGLSAYQTYQSGAQLVQAYQAYQAAGAANTAAAAMAGEAAAAASAGSTSGAVAVSQGQGGAVFGGNLSSSSGSGSLSSAGSYVVPVAAALVMANAISDLSSSRNPEQIAKDQAALLQGFRIGTDGEDGSTDFVTQRGTGGGLREIGDTQAILQGFQDGSRGREAFVTGQTADQFGAFAQGQGLDVINYGAGVKVIAEDQERLNQLIADFDAQLNNVQVTSETVMAQIATGSISAADTFENNWITAFGGTKDSAKKELVQVDSLFDQFVKTSTSDSEAVYLAIAEHFGLSTEAARMFVENSGKTADEFAEQFRRASGESTDFIELFSQRAGSSLQAVDADAEAVAGSIANEFRGAAAAAGAAFAGIEFDGSVNVRTTSIPVMDENADALTSSKTLGVGSSGIKSANGIDEMFLMPLLPNREETTIAKRGSMEAVRSGIENIERQLQSTGTGGNQELMDKLDRLIFALEGNMDLVQFSNAGRHAI